MERIVKYKTFMPLMSAALGTEVLFLQLIQPYSELTHMMMLTAPKLSRAHVTLHNFEQLRKDIQHLYYYG
jgi:hypothetical protein